MWSLATLERINHVASILSNLGKPERDAVALVTDRRRKDELAILEAVASGTLAEAETVSA